MRLVSALFCLGRILVLLFKTAIKALNHNITYIPYGLKSNHVKFKIIKLLALDCIISAASNFIPLDLDGNSM
jgi:hypothetical protein